MSLKKIPDYFPLDWRFGTDGIRGPVESKMNPLFIVKLGWAAGKVFKEEGIEGVIIGKDTRISGYMIESALESGFISAGINVSLVGPMPTPVGVQAMANLYSAKYPKGAIIFHFNLGVLVWCLPESQPRLLGSFLAFQLLYHKQCKCDCIFCVKRRLHFDLFHSCVEIVCCAIVKPAEAARFLAL